MTDRLSTLSQGLKGSLILRIGAEVRDLIAAGQPVCNLSVGDFGPSEFQVPSVLAKGAMRQIEAGETYYPASSGMPELRGAVVAFYKKWLALDIPIDGVLIVAGGRPTIYGAYRALVNPGDRVVYPTPSWSNEYYTPMVGAISVEVPCGVETGFLPTAAALAPALKGARLLVLNSPMNPAGTVFTEEQLGGICDAVLAENARRGAGSVRSLCCSTRCTGCSRSVARSTSRRPVCGRRWRRTRCSWMASRSRSPQRVCG